MVRSFVAPNSHTLPLSFSPPHSRAPFFALVRIVSAAASDFAPGVTISALLTRDPGRSGSASNGTGSISGFSSPESLLDLGVHPASSVASSLSPGYVLALGNEKIVAVDCTMFGVKD